MRAWRRERFFEASLVLLFILGKVAVVRTALLLADVRPPLLTRRHEVLSAGAKEAFPHRSGLRFRLRKGEQNRSTAAQSFMVVKAIVRVVGRVERIRLIELFPGLDAHSRATQAEQ